MCSPGTPDGCAPISGVGSGSCPMRVTAVAAQSRRGRGIPLQPSEGSAQTMNDIHQSLAHQGLVRPREGRVLGGVCAGLGRRFGLAPWTARLLFVRSWSSRAARS